MLSPSEKIRKIDDLKATIEGMKNVLDKEVAVLEQNKVWLKGLRPEYGELPWIDVRREYDRKVRLHTLNVKVGSANVRKLRDEIKSLKKQLQAVLSEPTEVNNGGRRFNARHKTEINKNRRQERGFMRSCKEAELRNVEYGPEVSDGVEEQDYAEWAANIAPFA